MARGRRADYKSNSTAAVPPDMCETKPDSESAPPPPPAPDAEAGAPAAGDGASEEAEPASGPTPSSNREDAAGVGEAPIPDASLDYWATLDDGAREQACGLIDEYYETLLEEFRVSANEFVTQYRDNSDLGRRWRFWLIVLTGGLALLNVLASSWPDGPYSEDIRRYMTFAAAVYAVLLALGTNIESFHNYADKKLSARESRELFLDAYREFGMLRLAYVYPFGTSPQGCFNLHALYKRLVAKDAELRRKLKQLTMTADRDRNPAGRRT
jgi:hypothetical protein